MFTTHTRALTCTTTHAELDVDVQKCMVQFPVAVKVHVVSVRDCSEPFGEQLAAARLSSLSSVAATYSGSCFSTAAPTSRCSSYSLAAKVHVRVNFYVNDALCWCDFVLLVTNGARP